MTEVTAVCVHCKCVIRLSQDRWYHYGQADHRAEPDFFSTVGYRRMMVHHHIDQLPAGTYINSKRVRRELDLPNNWTNVIGRMIGQREDIARVTRTTYQKIEA